MELYLDFPLGINLAIYVRLFFQKKKKPFLLKKTASGMDNNFRLDAPAYAIKLLKT
jgi:hypothetical protein